jgi:hypothetical protein
LMNLLQTIKIRVRRLGIVAQPRQNGSPLFRIFEEAAENFKLFSDGKRTKNAHAMSP